MSDQPENIFFDDSLIQKAVETQKKHQRRKDIRARASSFVRYSYGFLIACFAIGLLTLLVSLGLSFLFDNSSESNQSFYVPGTASSSAFTEGAQISTTVNVFDNVETDSGVVTTGREYQPPYDNGLVNLSSTWCYILIDRNGLSTRPRFVL